MHLCYLYFFLSSSEVSGICLTDYLALLYLMKRYKRFSKKRNLKTEDLESSKCKVYYILHGILGGGDEADAGD